MKKTASGRSTAAEKRYQARLAARWDELKWLYCELYSHRPDAMDHLQALADAMRRFYDERSASLKARDRRREADPDWYRRNDLMGMMLYVHNFGGTLRGTAAHIDYLKECGVNYLHLMPLLASPRGKSDGGYAVADFRAVQPELGTMEDFAALTAACHKNGINVCLDFVMNHTSDEHEWARRARAGEKEFQDRYFFLTITRSPTSTSAPAPRCSPPRRRATSPGCRTAARWS